MKVKIFSTAMFLFIALTAYAQDDYYFAGKGKLNSQITTPEAFFGFKIGTSLVRYDKVVEYYKLLASQSERASFLVFGKSWEDREQIKLFVTSPENQKNLEQIRLEHLKLIDPAALVDIKSQKVIVELSYNVHGGEIAGTDASVLAAYFLVASEDKDIVGRLNEAVILLEPAQNPDGRERAVNYINGFHSWPPVSDPADREHGSGITPHRGNHFWNDLNRDWLPLSQIESQNRVAFYHRWYPNIYLDFHEMGSGSTYYFEPSPHGSWNNIIPLSNYETLNEILAKYFSKTLDEIGSLYYTKESFTNLSPIYGSTYPDYQGGVGVTLEVGSTSGVELETAAGIRKFSKNLRDNFLISIAAVRAATDSKEVFLDYQKEFFKSALTQADKLPVKSIVFGNKNDKSLTALFLKHLLQHNIEVYELASDFSQDEKQFAAGSAYVVPLRQKHFRILQSIFEENETNAYTDKNVFYDISASSTVHGYGITFAKSKTKIKEGDRITTSPEIKGAVTGRSELAYAFDYYDYLAPKALYFLQDNGIKARVSQQPFTNVTEQGNKTFAAGTIIIPVAYQTLSSDDVYKLVNEAANLANITVYALSNGYSASGIDLGSNNIRVLKKPVVAIIGNGWQSIGESWALLGNTHNIPLVKISAETAAKVDLYKYTSIILSDGQITPPLSEELIRWTEKGGTLIALSGAVEWASSKLLSNRVVDSTAITPNVAASASTQRGGFGRDRLAGIVVRSELNLQHPLSYGFSSKDFYTLKNSPTGLNITSPSNVVLKINEGVLVNGYATAEAVSKLNNKVIIASASRGSGSVVLFGESPTFRGYYLASGRILTNALFFGTNSGGGRERNYD
ncbi:MAG: hypothetical protein LBD53_00375 [Tannerella sp.]|jgi:hypothetical protein|nr:hypothetical protein [Tannerella sp.]